MAVRLKRPVGGASCRLDSARNRQVCGKRRHFEAHDPRRGRGAFRGLRPKVHGGDRAGARSRSSIDRCRRLPYCAFRNSAVDSDRSGARHHQDSSSDRAGASAFGSREDAHVIPAVYASELTHQFGLVERKTRRRPPARSRCPTQKLPTSTRQPGTHPLLSQSLW